MEFANFWKEADKETIVEKQGEIEYGDYYPWSPPILLDCLKQDIKWLEDTIQHGNDTDSEYYLVQIAQLSATISKSLKEWRWGNDFWFRVNRQERSLKFFKDNGDKTYYWVTNLANHKHEIRYQKNDEPEIVLDVVSDGQPIANAIRDYLEFELQNHSSSLIHTSMIPISHIE